MPVNHYRDRLPGAMLNAWGVRTPNPLLAGSYLEHDGQRYWWVYDGQGQEITKWECRPFPGCATLVVTTHIELRADLRGRGLGKYFHELRRKAYKAAGFQGEVCTVRSDSDAQTAIVTGSGTCMGTYPSDFGGTFNVWLLPLNPLAPPADTSEQWRELINTGRTMPTPAPQVDMCGNRRPYTNTEFCEKPPGHVGAHFVNGHQWPHADIEPPHVFHVALPENPTVPVRMPARKPKTFSHRTPR